MGVKRLKDTNLVLDTGTQLTSSVTTWTPSLTFSNPGTFSVSGLTVDGVYQKIGNICFFDARISGTPTIGTASGATTLSLPLPIATITGSNLVGVMNGYTSLLIGITFPTGAVEIFPDLGTPGSSLTNLAYYSATGQNAIQASNFTTGTAFSLRYGGRFYTP